MMATTTVALGLVTALDIATARRLYDYGELDDDGVTAALEQIGLEQNRGADGRPWYLTRLRHAAAVIDTDDGITLAAFAADSLDEERDLLRSLFAVWPPANGRLVSWHATDATLLLRRAYMHELQVPAAVRTWPRAPLCHLLDVDVGAPDYDVQGDVLALYGSRAPMPDTLDPALRAAVNWHDMDLRSQCVTGAIDPDTRSERLARVAAQLATFGMVTGTEFAR